MNFVSNDENKNICTCCPRHCKVDRSQRGGFCNELSTIRVAKVIEHFMWEEPCITGKGGALAIFFSGCNLKCSYCQNYEISCGQVGKEYTIDEFIQLLDEKIDGHEYLDLITPTHFSKQLLEIFKRYNIKIPVVWNSSSYEDLSVIDDIFEYVDIFLMDFKYSSNALGKKYSNCQNYFDVASKVLSKCALKRDVFDTSGNMKEGLIIRHLILPGEIENSLGCIEYIARNFKDRMVSLMSQFTPNGKGVPNRKLTPLEYKIVYNRLLELGIERGYFQEFSSADSCFVPDFLDKND